MRLHVLAGSLLLVGACAFGYRAERQFTRAFDVAEYETLYVQLPDAPERVAQVARERPQVRVEGVFSSLGGTQAVAEAQVEDAAILSEDLGDTLRLFSHWPAEAEGLTSLETQRLIIPPGMPLSLVARSGDMRLQSLSGDADIDLGVGDVVAEDARADHFLVTGSGRVELSTARPLLGSEAIVAGYDLGVYTGRGDVELRQRSVGSIYAESGQGDIEISVPSDAQLDIYVYASQGIDWDTTLVQLDEPGGEWRETLGDGTQSLVVIAHRGRVRVRED